jgi:cobalt/nickel transport system permease protein
MMHIPDGYLSPSTCAVAYAAAAPFWYVALRRVKRLLNTRMVPLIAVFSAFSFVIMMFNLPLPGGTTGHAVGLGIDTVILGPWAAMLTVSIALLIQAVFFGDGGITTFGANCFNMAIVGSWVAYGVYRMVAAQATLTASRRAVAAAIAGYVGINVSALLAAIEFGIQPALFHDASSMPLYAPYPLHIAVPAMMLGHLTFAGLAEGVITGGLVAYLQRSDASLLMRTAPGVHPHVERVSDGSWSATRRLWLGIALLMVLTPLGLLASATAWGEWSASDFSDPAMRQKIEAASGNQVLPTRAAPHGLARLSSIWTAPIPAYAPPFMRSATFGYMMSALLGSGLIILTCLGISWIAMRRRSYQPGAA